MDIKLRTSKGTLIAKDVPITSWEELKPYWIPIAKAVIEVFLIGNFKPYSVRKDRKDGFYAAEWYWEKSLSNPSEYPLKEAKKFLNMLKKNKDFINAVNGFNSIKGSNWTSNLNIKRLRHFVYSVCHELEGYLKLLTQKQ